ncbi:MAG: hypothetical protein IPM54_16835 [Polyangiaceae bacterium]|nr:hypothetical protein [Polyangiaceae bacterium]
MGKPSYDERTLAAYFQPLDAIVWEDPLVRPVLESLAETDPDLLAAVADVDRSQIRQCLDRTPAERLATAAAHWRGLSRWRLVGP